MSLKQPLAVLAAAAALSACATASRIGDAVWPLGDDPAPQQTAPQDGRVPILTFEQLLTPDPELVARGVIVPAPSPGGDWSQPGGNPANAPVALQGAETLSVAWRQTIGQGSNRRERLSAPPVIVGDTVYVLDANQTVQAFDANNGDRRWSRNIRRPQRTRDGRAVGGGVAVADGKLFVTSGYGVAAALDAATGREIWLTATGAPFHAAPTVAGGRMYAVTNESELLAFDAQTGAVVWTHQAIAEPARILAASSPAVQGDTVVAPFASGEIIALVAANGRRLWVDALSRSGRLTSLAAINDVAGRPVSLDGVVYAASHSGILAAIDQRTGQRIWARNMASTQTPWVAGNVLYVVSVDGELAAIDRATGGVVWVRQLQRFEDQRDSKGRIAWTGPILVGGRLILASSHGEAVQVNPSTGEVVQTLRVGGAVFIPPVSANGQVYLLTDEARLVVLR